MKKKAEDKTLMMRAVVQSEVTNFVNCK